MLVERLLSTLNAHPLFRDIHRAQVRLLSRSLRVKEYQDEEIICHCSDACHDSFLLIDGVVAVTRKMGDDVHVGKGLPVSCSNVGWLASTLIYVVLQTRRSM